MKDKDQKFKVISNKKVIKRFAAVADSNISDSSEKIDEPKKEIQEEKPFILSKNNLVKEESVILEKKSTIKKLSEETITDAKIALINTALEISKTETDAKINISNPQQAEEDHHPFMLLFFIL